MLPEARQSLPCFPRSSAFYKILCPLRGMASCGAAIPRLCAFLRGRRHLSLAICRFVRLQRCCLAPFTPLRYYCVPLDSITLIPHRLVSAAPVPAPLDAALPMRIHQRHLQGRFSNDVGPSPLLSLTFPSRSPAITLHLHSLLRQPSQAVTPWPPDSCHVQQDFRDSAFLFRRRCAATPGQVVAAARHTELSNCADTTSLRYDNDGTRRTQRCGGAAALDRRLHTLS